MTPNDSSPIQRRDYLKWMGAAGLAATGVSGHAQSAWPNKPIRWVVPYTPGGFTDNVTRMVTAKLQPILGENIIIENRAGAAGTIGADVVAKSPADGYTLLMGHSNSNAIAPFVLPKIPFNAGTDFTPITYVGYVPNVLVLHPSIPAKNIPDETIST